MFTHDSISCDQVTNELAVPTGTLDQAAIDQHLASCPPCASQYEQLRRIDRVWQATRPGEPDEAHWQQLWSQVEDQVFASIPAARYSTSAGAPARQRWATIWAFAAVAQAAAVLLAAWIFFRPPVNSPDAAVVPPGPSAPSTSQPGAPELTAATARPAAHASVQVEYELEEGQTLFLVLDSRGETVVVKPRFVSTEELVAFDGESPDPYASAFQMTFVMLNAMEGME